MTTLRDALRRRAGGARQGRMAWPAHRALYLLQRAIGGALAEVARRGWWTPVFRSLVETPAPGLRLDHGVPRVEGPLRLRLGRGVGFSGGITLRARQGGGSPPVLEVGDNVRIGRDSVISVGTQVRVGRNAWLGTRTLLDGDPGHPPDAGPCAPGDECHAIVIGDGVWLGTGVIVLAGVSIGGGTVVSAGSVVTHDLPPRILAGGNPARVLRTLGPVNDP